MTATLRALRQDVIGIQFPNFLASIVSSAGDQGDQLLREGKVPEHSFMAQGLQYSFACNVFGLLALNLIILSLMLLLKIIKPFNLMILYSQKFGVLSAQILYFEFTLQEVALCLAL